MAQYEWTGGSGQFEDPAQWTPASVPGAGDTATVASGVVLADGLTLSDVAVTLAPTGSTQLLFNFDGGTLADGAILQAVSGQSVLEGDFVNNATLAASGTATSLTESDVAGTNINTGLLSASAGGTIAIGNAGEADFDETATGMVSVTGANSRVQIVAAQTITLDGDATVSGSGASLNLSPGDGQISGAGTISLSDGGALSLGGTSVAGLTVGFGDGAGENLGIRIDMDFQAALTDFQAGDTITILGERAEDVSWSDGILYVGIPGNNFQAIHLTSSSIDYADADFVVTSGAIPDGPFYSQVTILPCFAGGTRIATERGEVAVERLAVGDLVRTPDGRLVPVVWIGARTVDIARHPTPEKVQPICIQAGAFGGAVPHRDLLLSPDHAVLAEGVLIPAKHLVNDLTVLPAGMARVTYFHVELAAHDILLAEGLPCESYLDMGDRDAFGGDVTRLHPIWGQGGEPSLRRDALSYAPLRVAGEEVAAVRGRLATEAARRAVVTFPTGDAFVKRG